MVFSPRKKVSPSKKFEYQLSRLKHPLIEIGNHNFNFYHSKAKSARRLDYSSINTEEKENSDLDESSHLNALRFYCKKTQYLSPLERKVLGVSKYRNVANDIHVSRTKCVPTKFKLHPVKKHKALHTSNVHRKTSRKFLKKQVQNKRYLTDAENYIKDNAKSLKSDTCNNACTNLAINKNKDENLKGYLDNLTCRKFFTSRNESSQRKVITSSEDWKKGLRLKFKSGVAAVLNKSIHKVSLSSQDTRGSISLNKTNKEALKYTTKELIIPLYRLKKKDILLMTARGLTSQIQQNVFETKPICATYKTGQNRESEVSNYSSMMKDTNYNGKDCVTSVSEENLFDLDVTKSQCPVLSGQPTYPNKGASTIGQPSMQLNEENSENSDHHLQEKVNGFFPIFSLSTPKSNRLLNKDQQNPSFSTKCSSFNNSHIMPKFLCKTDGKEQLIIDAGQKDIGAKQCSVCNMVYTRGEPQDEKLHSSYHELFLSSLKFPGWKKEHVLGEFYDGRVIMVTKNDQNFKVKKLEDIMRIVDRDLGFPDLGLPCKMNTTFILFISNEKRVVGCLVAESITQACRVVLDTSSKFCVPCLPTSENTTSRSCNLSCYSEGLWCSSSETVKAFCGISRIWTSFDNRRRKIASRMVDCLRCNFIYGYALSMDEIAFSDPSLDGRAFATSYTGTPFFLVYK